MHAVVTGMIATYPLGGVAWDYGQYALGLERLGFDVWYLEDTGGETYDPPRRTYSSDPSFGLDYLQRSLAGLSSTLAERWHFVDVTGNTHGVPRSEFDEIVGTADVFLNVSGGTQLRKSYLASPRKVFIDTDPGWNHFVKFPEWDAASSAKDTFGFRAHDVFFTFAELLGRPDCRLPDFGIRWHPTRHPVLLDEWSGDGSDGAWTTVMSWDNFRRPIEHEGEVYGSKELEFPKVERLPVHVPTSTFEVAVGGTSGEAERWRALGWRVTDSHDASATPDVYRNYIQRSRGEFSVAKNVYVATRSGWFSGRSACYLAAGRPVVVQDTGFGELIPTGHGLFAFDDIASAAAAIEAVETDYAAHSDAARALAEEYFASDVILGRLLDQAGVS